MTKSNWSFFAYSEDPDFDDDDLEEIQRIVWQGYVPKPYPRHDWYVWPPVIGRYHPPMGMAKDKPFVVPRKTKLKDAVKALKKKVVPQYSTFKCDGCERTFRSVTDEEEADKAYRETFGPAATEERQALCEDCYDIVMEEFLK